MRIWVTRTQPGADRTAAQLQRLGHEALVQPVLEVEALDTDLDLSRADYLAFTSGHAVTLFAERTPRRDMMAFVVGKGTAAVAAEAGFEKLCESEGDVRNLADLIDLTLADAPVTVVWPCAEQPAEDLRALLASPAVTCVAQPIYRTVERDQPAPSGLDAVLIHSPRAAVAVARLLPPDQAAGLALFAISPKAAEPLKDHPFLSVAIAPRPNETALISLIAG